MSQSSPTVLPVAFMTSFARSGETAVLRALNAHGQIVVLHQIVATTTADIASAFKKVVANATRELEVPASIHKDGSSLLLVKHAVWTHAFPHNGFTLARNPFSVVSSMKRYSEERSEPEDFRRSRLRRWADGIAKNLDSTAMSEVELLSTLYAIKMKAALEAGHPLFRYEDLLSDPEPNFQAIVSALGLTWDANVMTSERNYAVGDIGHGGIELWQPFRSGSVPAYSGGLTPAEFRAVAERTEPVLGRLGYSVTGETVQLAAADLPNR